MSDPVILVIVAAVFLLAGTVKGVIGMGLPTISLALLVIALDLPQAMVLLVVPSLITNLWQAFAGGSSGVVFTRVWPFLLAAALFIWIGTAAILIVNLNFLTGLLGVLLVVYGVLGLGGWTLNVEQGRQRWAGPLVGAVNGVLTGMTGSFVVPGVMYLQAIGLPRDQLMQAMGMLFSISTLALAIALQGRGLFPLELGMVSLVGLVPALVGMAVGQRIRAGLSESTFRRVFLLSLLVLGIYLSSRFLAG